MARDPEDITALNRLSGECLQRMRETGDTSWLARARHVAEQSLSAVPANVNPGGRAAHALVELASHHFTEAKAEASAWIAAQPNKSTGYEVRGDAELEQGDLAAAQADYTKALELEGESLAVHARFARLAVLRGDTPAAKLHFDAAVEFARADPEPKPFWIAWSFIQRGAWYFSRGDWIHASLDFSHAAEAQPGNWAVLDRLGELYAAQGKWTEAEKAFRDAIAQSPAPALRQALGDVLKAAGKPTEAAPFFEQAEAGYRASTEVGEAIYFHHLAAFYADSKPMPAEAERWARKDITLRRTAVSLDGLAWALAANGKLSEAAKTAHEALDAGAEKSGDPHVLYHAGLILMRADELPAGRALLKRAYEINPSITSFHVHR